MWPLASTAGRPHYTSVAVRFVTPPEPEPFTAADANEAAQLVVDASYDGFASTAAADGTTGHPAGAYHVALWGGPFEGNDVTFGVTPMTPGAYTFAFFDRETESTVQGWVDVHSVGDDVLDMLYKWKEGIPQQRRRLAYNYEISGWPDGVNADDFGGFGEQLEAFDRLERRIDEALAAERKAHSTRQREVGDLLRRSEILLMPGGEPFFHPTTLPAFNDADLASVRAGDVVTKIVLMADHADAVWKLRRVNELYGDLARCREVFRQEIDRLERRKGLMLLTDHLHHHDKRFVDNEIRLQQTLSSIDRLDEDLGDLRERRAALAFVTGLFDSDNSFSALDWEKRELMRERSVLQAEQRRIDLLLDKADETSVRRVALERKNQRNLAGIEAIDHQLQNLAEAHASLAAMAASTSVIHRQGDTRLLTATFVGKDLPFAVRRAVEREAVMTVRLETGRDLFVPTRAGATAATYQTGATFASQRERSQSDRSAKAYDDDSARLARFSESQRDAPEYRESRNQTARRNNECPLLLRLLVPPCWFAGRSDGSTNAAFDDPARLVNMQPADEWQQEENGDEDTQWRCDLPFFVRLLVPPCWFQQD
jgi:hypothetical protein